MSTIDTCVKIQGWNEAYQCYSYHEALQWLDYEEDAIAGLCFKTHHHSMQIEIKKFGDDKKE